MQYVEAACSISCFSFMPLQMLMVLTLNRSSYAKHSMLLRDKHSFLDRVEITLRMEFSVQRLLVSHHNTVRMEDLASLFSYSESKHKLARGR